mmetsp:Transcript_35681/g.83514  ORF Transcript_35681/g.83514 Transcript_35681/m.83514 type:complete len:124 (-) Transcript_35681:63-434(-)|eukprot:CAMPEP_0178431734 /NCGR_PEP_ID=MMETSP0689_2-20121128/32013_1 /TAXON_ID=160604 /ORGANISM="Amphidinium massartii, Strain CS-259" /LENGTH=123 /DNA_ID=CAMNT_0020053681 /DNA_START=84 /DNA_END=455 /DNA_ORIENTATION=-
MARATGRFVLLTAALVLARTLLPGNLAFVGARTRAVSPRGQISRVGRQAEVFVGNLDKEVSEEQLKDYMSKAAEVVSLRIKSGAYPKRFAFVEYKTDEDAQAAIDQLGGTELGTRKINLRMVE